MSMGFSSAMARFYSILARRIPGAQDFAAALSRAVCVERRPDEIAIFREETVRIIRSCSAERTSGAKTCITGDGGC